MENNSPITRNNIPSSNLPAKRLFKAAKKRAPRITRYKNAFNITTPVSDNKKRREG